MITEDQLNRFKDKLSKEKCDGEVTEVKLAEFIANYNSSGYDSTVFIENNTIMITPSMFAGGLNIKYTNLETKIKAMLSAMIYIMLHSRKQNVWFG